MDKKELYHFHKENSHDKEWKENKTINISENFVSTTYERIQNFNNKTEVNDNNLLYYVKFVSILHQYGIIDKKMFKEILTGDYKKIEEFNGTKLEYSIEQCRNLLKEVLEDAYNISFKSNEFKREMALENYRKDKLITKPSRLHCIYLTDEKGIDAWKNKFGNTKLTLYRVEAEGNIFKTNEQLIPDELLTYGETYKKAKDYWNPNFKYTPDNSNEYLVQGKVKILEKIERF